MALSEAKKKANKKYDKKTYEQLIVNVRYDAEINGTVIREHAANRGESVNGFLKRAIEETVERDNAAQI